MMQAAWLLFLDDERFPPDSPGKITDLWETLWNPGWVIARSVAEAKREVMARGIENLIFVSFDHDLNEIATGMDFAKWLIDHHLDGNHFHQNFDFTVHSMNPVGAANIEAIMSSFLRIIRAP